MASRPRFARGAAGVALALSAGVFALMAYSQDALPEVNEPRDMVTPKSQDAVDKGLNYLANRQAASGSFGTNRYQGNVAITSLGGLAFMSAGHQPGRGRYGQVVTRAVEYVLSQEQNTDTTGRHTPG